MSKTSAFVGFILLLVAFAACEKEAPYDSESQLEIDDGIISQYLADSNVTATKHPSGLYYVMTREGSGDVDFEKDTVLGNYSMKILMDSAVLSQSLDSTFRLQRSGYIVGWQIGLSLIGPGGRIRVIVPSTLGFQRRLITTPGTIPPNSILDITLEIDTVKKLKTND